MNMRVISYGIRPENVFYVSVCGICNSVIEYQRKEATIRNEGLSNEYMVLACPVCKRVMHCKLRDKLDPQPKEAYSGPNEPSESNSIFVTDKIEPEFKPENALREYIEKHD